MKIAGQDNIRENSQLHALYNKGIQCLKTELHENARDLVTANPLCPNFTINSNRHF